MYDTPPVPNPRRRILVVDDERAIADTLALILKASGYEASATYSGDSAIELCPRLQPDLVISDIAMPGTDGLSAVLKIREQSPDTRLMLFSGHPDAHWERAQENGLEIMAKPLAPEFLLHRIKQEFDGLARGSSAAD